MKHNTLQNKKGFTLVETMVAISVLMFAILGPLSIASSGLVNARIARDQVTAFYLAQEGLEFVRFTRDTNFLQNQNNVMSDPGSGDPDNWIFGLEDCFSNDGCQIDVEAYFDRSIPGNIVSPCTGKCEPLSIRYDTGIYTYHPNSSVDRFSPFVRTVRIEEVPNTRGVSDNSNNEIKVISTVTWSTGLIDKTVELTENLSNIYDYE